MARAVTRTSTSSKGAQQQSIDSADLATLLNQKQPYENAHKFEIPNLMEKLDNDHQKLLQRFQGSLVGLAVGDALGASVEFRPNEYLRLHPVTKMQSGGTWGLNAGQWTDDTSMMLCLAASLLAKSGFNAYDQLVRYKWWHKSGYMSSTGTCFDIGNATRGAISEFQKRQTALLGKLEQSDKVRFRVQATLDLEMSDEYLKFYKFDTKCGSSGSAGNGPLMRLAPISLFFSHSEFEAIQYAGESVSLTHGNDKAIDACRFYAALICGALRGEKKDFLLSKDFYLKYFRQSPLHSDVVKIVEGSYKQKNGYKDGIRGKGFVLNALEAALWAFYNDKNSFKDGVLLAIHLGDDTDTTAAIYGQLAGAMYGVDEIPSEWRRELFQYDFIVNIANHLFVEGENYWRKKTSNNTSNGSS